MPFRHLSLVAWTIPSTPPHLSLMTHSLFHEAWAPDTHRGYAVSWRFRSSWCVAIQIDPVTSSLTDLLNFLAYVYKKGRPTAPSTFSVLLFGLVTAQWMAFQSVSLHWFTTYCKAFTCLVPLSSLFSTLGRFGHLVVIPELARQGFPLPQTTVGQACGFTMSPLLQVSF